MSKEKIIRCKCCKGEAYGYLIGAMVNGKCPYCDANCLKQKKCKPGKEVDHA